MDRGGWSCRSRDYRCYQGLENLSEVVILPEMLAAGMEALRECESREYEEADVVIAVYMAMEAVKMIAIMRSAESTVH